MKNRRRLILGLGALLLILAAALLVLWQVGPPPGISRLLMESKIQRVEADPAAGFHWPYYLYVPKSARVRGARGETLHLLVLPNNTGEPSDDLAVHEEAARGKIDQYEDIPAHLGTPLLIPIFPRPWDVYLERDLYVHALDRRTLQTEIPDLERVDLQLVAMLDDAEARLEHRGWEVDDEALLMGFSASGMFANRFALLHPEHVLAAAIGSPGGWPIAPLEAWEGHALDYPLGVHDLEALTGRPFDLAAYRATPHLFYLGDQDDNDAVDAENYAYLSALFGATPVERWPDAEVLYRSAGADAEFRLDPGVGHTIGPETRRYMIDFFAGAIAASEGRAE